MTEGNNQDRSKKQKKSKKSEPIDYDWRDPTKPRNTEDDMIVEGWRRRADGTFEKVEDVEDNEVKNETEDGQ